MTDFLQKILFISLGSALGGNARYWLGTWVQQKWETNFPWGTFLVNVSGAFFLGLIISLVLDRMFGSSEAVLRLFFVVGFAGSYTTFSALEFETLLLVEKGSHFLAVFYAVSSLIVGFIALYFGILLGKFLF